MKQLTIVGAGWAGLAAAVAATQSGWQVQLFEASHAAGGRARSLHQIFAGHPLDNGQHILIGAYRDTLTLMRTVGINPDDLLQRQPLDLRYANGQGLSLPNMPAPLHLLAGICVAKGWRLNDKVRLIQAAWKWQRAKFECDTNWTVLQLCQTSHLSTRVITQLIEPLCLSALNTHMHEASASVFLRVLHDALMGGTDSSDLLLPRSDLGALLPHATLRWLGAHGAEIHLGKRISAAELAEIQNTASPHNVLLLACPAWEAARLSADIAPIWAAQCAALRHAAIATVYLHCKDKHFRGLTQPMVALHSHSRAPAQFVFDRGLLSGQTGLLAAVVSACTTERKALAEQVQSQVRTQLGLHQLDIVQTVVEKRATLACTPMLDRPAALVAHGLWACGDYISGPYPSTLEGAVRSGQQVVAQLSQMTHC